MLALKLFGNNPLPLAESIIARVASDNLGLEVLLLTGKSERVPLSSIEWSDSPQLRKIRDKTLHLDHHRSQGCQIFNKDTRQSVLLDISTMHSLGISQGVMHYHHAFPEEQRTYPALTKNLVEVNRIAEENDVTFFLENTTLLTEEKVGVSLYWAIFGIVAQRGLSNLGFCFDIGHAKALSDTKLVGWITLLDHLKASGIPLHFHLHNNDGTADEHLSFRLAELRGLNDGDAFTGGTSYLSVVAMLIQRYPGLKLLEVNAEEAIPSLDWIQARL